METYEGTAHRGSVLGKGQPHRNHSGAGQSYHGPRPTKHCEMTLYSGLYGTVVPVPMRYTVGMTTASSERGSRGPVRGGFVPCSERAG